MAEKDLHINYSIEDIERYLNGSMHAKEMHEMERAALNDPFLADAIEGYSENNFETSHAHLNEIHAAVHKKKEGAKVIPIVSKKFNWLNAAAVALVVIITGGVSWYIIGLNKNSDQTNHEISAISEERSAQIPTDSLNKKTDTAAIIAQLSKPEKQKLAKQPEATYNYKKKETPTGNPVTIQDKESRADSVDDKKKLPLPVTSAAPAASGANTNNDISVAKSINIIAGKQPVLLYNGRVTDNNNKPVANATVVAPGNIQTFTNEQGYFSLRSVDSALNVTVSSIGFNEAETQLTSSVSNNIVINPDNNSLSEVVVTGFGKKRVVTKNTDSTSAHPAVGWESFQEYVYKQLNRPMDTTLSDFTSTGNVQLEFSVDKDGAPIDFKVIKSLDPLYDNRAIDIVKKGPKWIAGKKTKKAKVTIQF